MRATGSPNPTIDILLGRKSIRDYEDRPIPEDIKDLVIAATLRSATAGNMMLYQIIEVEDGARREFLSHSCDEQPFIAKAPWILVFVADYQRWYDYFVQSEAAIPGPGVASRAIFLQTLTCSRIHVQRKMWDSSQKAGKSIARSFEME